MIRIAFRLDDPSPTSDHALERRILECFGCFSVPLTVAVVPYGTGPGRVAALDRNAVPHLVDAQYSGAIEVMLHGHSHINRANSRPPSEFRGLPAPAQERLLREGIAVLSDVFRGPIAGLVPPWNTWDAGTAQAARAVGLTVLSAATGPSGTVRGRGVRLVPRTCTLRNVRSAIDEARRFAGLAPVVVCVMHPDDFREYRDPPLPGEDAGFTGLDSLEALLRDLREARDIRFTTVGALANGRPLRCPADVPAVRWLPWRLRTRVPGNVLVGSVLSAAFAGVLRG